MRALEDRANSSSRSTTPIQTVDSPIHLFFIFSDGWRSRGAKTADFLRFPRNLLGFGVAFYDFCFERTTLCGGLAWSMLLFFSEPGLESLCRGLRMRLEASLVSAAAKLASQQRETNSQSALSQFWLKNRISSMQRVREVQVPASARTSQLLRKCFAK